MRRSPGGLVVVVSRSAGPPIFDSSAWAPERPVDAWPLLDTAVIVVCIALSAPIGWGFAFAVHHKLVISGMIFASLGSALMVAAGALAQSIPGVPPNPPAGALGGWLRSAALSISRAAARSPGKVLAAVASAVGIVRSVLLRLKHAAGEVAWPPTKNGELPQ